jgi:hypothetical protein
LTNGGGVKRSGSGARILAAFEAPVIWESRTLVCFFLAFGQGVRQSSYATTEQEAAKRWPHSGGAMS